MLVIFFAFLAIASSVSSAPSRERRSNYPEYYPFGFPKVFAGAYAGFPFFNPYPMPWYFPMPDFSSFTPWYKGDNVCVDKRDFDEPEEMKEWLNEGFGDSSFNYESASEQCKGSDEKMVCMKRIATKEGSKMEMLKYTCCHGFVRPRDGRPGCVENTGMKTPSGVPPAAQTGSRSTSTNDHVRFTYVTNNNKRASAVDNVSSP